MLNNRFPKKIQPFALLMIGVGFIPPAFAENIYAYKKGDNQQLFLTNIKQNQGGPDKFTEISVTYYPDTKLHKGDIPSTYNPSTASTPSRSANRNAYDHLIVSAGMRHGVDPALIKAIIHTESAFNPNARSPVGAMGLMQLMPGTARDMGVMNPWDPAQNIEGGTKYLAWLQKQFRSRDLVVASYNAGLGNVKKYGGIPPFRETQNYVKSVNGRYSTLYHGTLGSQGGVHLAMNTPQVSTTPIPAPSHVQVPTSRGVQTVKVSYNAPETPAITNSTGRIFISSANQ